MRMPKKWRDDERQLKTQLAQLLELLREMLNQSVEEDSESWRAFNLSNVPGRGVNHLSPPGRDSAPPAPG